MPHWLVQVKGDVADLRDLCHWLPCGETQVTFEGEAAFLVDKRLELATDHRQVFDMAESICESITSAGRLMHVVGQPILPTIVHRVNPDGTRTSRGFVCATLPLSWRIKRPLPFGDGHTVLQMLVAEVARSQHLKAAVEASTAGAVSWPRLYRALEEIEQYLGASVSAAGLCSEAERERLKRTANSAEAAGLDARHRLEKYQAPSNPMTLHEATEFVRRLIEGAVKFKVAHGAA